MNSKGRAKQAPAKGKSIGSKSTAEHQEILQHVPLLRGISPRERAEVSARFHLEEAPRGALIVRQGEESDRLYILVDGRAKVKKVHGDGQEVILAYLEAGEVIGELGIITGSPRNGDVVALTSCILASITKAEFDNLIDSCPGFSRALLRSLAYRVQSTGERLRELTFLDVPQRLLLALARMAVPYEEDGRRCLLVRERPSQSDLAQLLSCTREAVSRAFRELKEKEALDAVDGQVVLYRVMV